MRLYIRLPGVDGPRRRKPATGPTFDGYVRDRIVVPAFERPSLPNRIADAYWNAVVFVIKAVVGVVMAGVILACMWFVSAILGH